MKKPRGLYLAFEGGECVGKSAQVARVARYIGAQAVREPGGTWAGARLREILLDPSCELPAVAEAMLMAADRATLAATIIEPALANGTHVVSDRTWLSSLVYQGLRGVPSPDLEALNRLAIGPLLHPDLVILLDGDPKVVQQRRQSSGDRFESLGIDFHERVRQRFLEVATRLRLPIVQAENAQAEVSQQIDEIIRERFGALL